jgi:hypothetical protein
MSNVTTSSQLTGLFKQVYGSEIENLIPESAKVVKMVPFAERDKLGDKYNQPVILTTEQGVTYASSEDTSAFDLEAPVSMSTKNAEVKGSQMLLRSAIAYEAASKATASEKAFVGTIDLVVDNMLESITKRLEVGLIHGQSGIGAVAVEGFTSSTTTGTMVLTAASWASGIWAGAEGVRLTLIADFGTTNVNPYGSATDIIVTSVNNETRTVTVSGDATGLAAIATANETLPLTVFYKGTVSGSEGTFEFIEMAGLRKIFTNTSTLFNINAGQYHLWKANTYDANGKLTMGKVLSAVGKAVDRGLNEDVVLLVNPKTWADLASELSALRSFDASYSATEGDNGFKSLKYYSQNGTIEVISHNIVKEGEAYIFPPKRLKRIGTTDITFSDWVGKSQDIFLHLPNKAGLEMRCYSNQSIFVETPARCVLITGIVNG